MIIADPSTSPAKGAPQPAPPSYQATQNPQRVYVQPQVPAHIVYAHSPLVPSRERTAGRRFIRAFFVAVLIWFLFGVFVRSLVELAYWNHKHGRWTQMDFPGDFSIPVDTHLRTCLDDADWSRNDGQEPRASFPFHSRASFELPVSADAFMFLARGGRQAGQFNVVSSSEVSDTAKIDVIVNFRSFEARARGHVCRIRRKDGGVGLGIFTPPQSWYIGRRMEDELFFSVTVHLPATSDGSPLRIKQFATDLPLYSQRIGHVEDHVKFQNITLRSSNMPISIESLYAQTASVHTSNSPISGSFNTSSVLSLTTSNSPIKVDVGLANDDQTATSLVMKTSNSPVHASVSLLKKASAHNRGGKYDVTGATSNGEIVFDFPASPVDSVLKLHGTTSNGRAIATLHPAYEGSFRLKTSIFRPEVQRTSAVDPSGRERRRSVEYSTYQRGLVEGRVKWAGSNAPGGVVDLKTSNTGVTLKI